MKARLTPGLLALDDQAGGGHGGGQADAQRRSSYRRVDRAAECEEILCELELAGDPLAQHVRYQFELGAREGHMQVERG